MKGERSVGVTDLLELWRSGDDFAGDRLMEVIYPELRRLAAGYLRGESRSHTLQPTALVNEAYLRLVGSEVDYQDRVHFVAVAARVMRRVLVDHAKAKKAQKRGGDRLRVTLSDDRLGAGEHAADVLALDEGLARLAEIDPRKCRVVELHFFGGLTYDETAQALSMSAATVNRELRFAKAWLADAMREPGA